MMGRLFAPQGVYGAPAMVPSPTDRNAISEITELGAARLFRDTLMAFSKSLMFKVNFGLTFRLSGERSESA
jgi:hypothetical protein